MNEKDRVDPEGSNGSPDNNVEKFDVDFEGEKYPAMIKDGEITVYADLPESKLDNLAAESKAQLAALKKKNFDLNREKESLEAERKQLAEERRMLDLEKQTPKPQPTSSNPIKQAFGVETWDEVAQLQIDDPAAYVEGNAKYASLSAQAKGAQAAYETVLENQIRNDGFNPQEVKQFAKVHGIGSLSSAYVFFKREVEAGTKRVSLPDLQKAAVKIAPAGKGGHSGTVKKQSLREAEETND